MQFRRQLGFSLFRRIFIVVAMSVAVKGLLIPTRKIFCTPSILGRELCWVPPRLHDTTRRGFLQTTKRSSPHFTTRIRTGQRFFASQSESTSSSISLENLDFDEIDLGEEVDDLDDVEEGSTIDLPKGASEGFYIVKTYKTEPGGFDMNLIRTLVDEDDIERLELTSKNISVPVALMMFDNKEYPSRSRARKACRKANIMIHRGPLSIDDETGENVFDSTKCIRARVGDRIFPGGRFGNYHSD